ncbi:MAG: FlgO family outer membrane protein [Elusimicrobiota bacterium]
MSPIRTFSGVFLICLGLAAEGWAAEGLKSAAKRLSRAAEKAGVERVAVTPFVPLDDSDAGEGLALSERLTTRLARSGGPLVIERAMLPAVLEEHALGLTGLLDPAGLRRLGRMQQAEAVIMGSFVTLGNTLEANVRLVDIESGVVLEARSFRTRRTHYGRRDVFPSPEAITAEESVREVLAFQRGEERRSEDDDASSYISGPRRPMSERLLTRPAADGTFEADPARMPDLRDALAEEQGCVGASERIDTLQESILELKARYWALQAGKKGFSAKSLAVKPGAVIQDSRLRERFGRLLERAVRAGSPPLTMSEVKRFVSADRRAFQLYLRCSLNARKF